MFLRIIWDCLCIRNTWLQTLEPSRHRKHFRWGSESRCVVYGRFHFIQCRDVGGNEAICLEGGLTPVPPLDAGLPGSRLIEDRREVSALIETKRAGIDEACIECPDPFRFTETPVPLFFGFSLWCRRSYVRLRLLYRRWSYQRSNRCLIVDEVRTG